MLLAVACSWHLGTAPTTGFELVGTRAVVAEPGVEEVVGSAVVQALAARRALGSTPLELSITRAELRPGRRTGDTVIYDLTLAVEFRAGGRSRLVTVHSTLPDPGNAGAAAVDRSAAFRALAESAALEGVAWLTLGQ